MTGFRSIVDAWYAGLGWFYGLYCRFARWFKEPWATLMRCRAGILTTLAGSALLAVLPQGWEITRVAAEDDKWAKFYAAVLLLAFPAWFWSRVTCGDPRIAGSTIWTDQQRRWALWLPRVVGGLPFLGGTLPFFVYWLYDKTDNPPPYLKFVLIGVASFVLFEGLLYFRRQIAKRLFRGRSGMAQSLLVMFTALAGIASVAICAITLFDPVRIGSNTGAMGQTFITGGAFIFLAGGMIYSLENLRRREQQLPPGDRRYTHTLPVFVIAALLGILGSMFSHAYEIRSLEGKAEPRQGRRPTLENAVLQWQEQAAASCKMAGDDRPVMVIVASAGGASRAAYWTNTVLSEMVREGFNTECLFAMSGVSGGSLGLTTFLATMRDGGGIGGLDRSKATLSQDFLGPVMGALLVNDGVFAFSHFWDGLTRADALEGAFVRGWQVTHPDSKIGFDQDFFKLWEQDRQYPVLLLNSTLAQTGQRVITSNVNTRGHFVNAFDFFEDMRRAPIAVSTAVHNSARFSYVSPAGVISDDATRTTHLIDGGYYENYGAETALDLIRAVRAFSGASPRIVVVQIVSDPALYGSILEETTCQPGRLKLARRPQDPARQGTFSNWIGNNQFVLPVKGMLRTREARGMNEAMALKCEVQSGTERNYFSFNLDMADGMSTPALSWFLSGRTRKDIDGLLHQGDLKTRFERLMASVPKAPQAN